MLNKPKKLALSLVRPTHVELFVENYDTLRRWAAHFTESGQDAEDLLHDTFIQFTLGKPDLNSIQNLEGYLYILMRNLHLSQLRRATRLPVRSLSVVEFDTADVSFWASDPRDRLRLRDELGAVCHYACVRKESAKAGSVLILRFFHGYYPEEIAAVTRSNRSAVEKRLQKARAEAKLYLEDPDRLGFIDQKTAKASAPVVSPMGDDLRLELREQIFNSRQGECLTTAMRQAIYAPEGTEENSLDHRTIAHIVSCGRCLEEVNSLLGLPPLSSRYPLDTLGKDPGKKGGSSGGGGGEGGAGTGGPDMLDSFIRRRDAHFHHKPQELCISVNGQLQGFQKVVSGNSEMTLIIDAAETLGFVEVFSDQGLRLLMLNVEPPPAGEGRQFARVELSAGRTIDAHLNFAGAFPALQVTYHDPALAIEAAAETTDVPEATANDKTALPSLPATPARKETKWSARLGLKSLFKGLGYCLEPTKITAVCGVLIVTAVAGYLYLTRPVEKPPLTAGDLLASAAKNETALAADPELAVHRTYKIEEWSNGGLKSRRRVDDWEKRDASARRVFDEKENMVAGFWRAEGRQSQVFKLGEKLRSVLPGDDPAAESVAETKPSAAEFAAVVEKAGALSRLKLEESANAFALTYKKEADADQPPATNKLPGELLLASLVLERTSLQPAGETIVLRVGTETREYRFTDIRVEQKPVADVSPLIFLPEANLLRGATKVDKPTVELTGEITPGADTNLNTAINAANATNSPAGTRGATLETEVEVFKLLDSVNALSGEQISVSRTPQGQLKISGVVDSAGRKTEIVAALASVRAGRGVLIEIKTAEEAARRKAAAKSSNVTVSTESHAFDTDQSMPVAAELRALLAKRGVAPENMDQEMRAFAGTVTATSRSLRRNALALKQIAERFTPAEVERLEPGKKEEWKALVRSRARAVAGDVRQLSSQLAPLFPGSQGGGGSADVKDASDAAPAAQRLFGLAAACDAQVSQSFAITGGKESAPVRTVQLWRSLAQMASLSAELQKF